MGIAFVFEQQENSDTVMKNDGEKHYHCYNLCEEKKSNVNKSPMCD